MTIARTALVAFLTLCPALARAQLSDDLWDVSRGVVVTGHSSLDHDAGQGVDIRDAFGGAYTKLAAARATVVFDDASPDDFTDWIEWRTPSPVSVSRVMVHLATDVPSGERGVASFQVLSRLGPGNPWVKVAGSNRPPASGHFAAGVAKPTLAREFRAEFVRKPIPGSRFSGPRIVELDATGRSTPFVVAGPASRGPCVGGDAEFTVKATGTGPLNYAWCRNGRALADGPQESGSTVDGAGSPTLRVRGARAGDEGAFWCEVSNALGSVTTEPAMLRACIADCTCDGLVTAEDLACFEKRLAEHDPRADVNGDGAWGAADLSRFQSSLCAPDAKP